MPATIEQALLACCMMDPSCIDRAIQAGLKSAAFEEDRHSFLWDALVKLRGEGRTISPESVPMDLHREGLMEKAGGWSYLSGLTISVSTTASFEGSLAAVIEGHKKRLVGSCALALHNAARNGHSWGDVRGLLDAANEAAADTGMERTASVKETGAKCMAVVEDMIAGKPDTRTKIRTGIKGFDNACRRILPHEYVIVAARPGMGKTSLGLQIAQCALLDGLRVVFFSLEMAADQLLYRMATQRSGVPLEDVGRATRDKQEEYRQALQQLASSDLRIFDTDLRLEQIETRFRLIHETFRPHLYVLDYVQLIATDKETDREGISQASQSIMHMQKKSGCSWVVIAQLNRDSEDHREPRLKDLKGSGSLEQDAHRVIFIHRPEKDFAGQEQNTLGDPRSSYDCIIAQPKLRDGPTGGARARFLAPRTRFYDPTK